MFEGEKENEAASALYIDIVDGGLDQTIEARLNDLGHDVEISGIDNDAKVQFFTAK